MAEGEITSDGGNGPVKFRFFSLVYGKLHSDLYDKIAVRSLLQSRNRAAIPADSVVSLYTNEESLEQTSVAASMIAPVQVTIIARSSLAGVALQSALITEIERCLKDGSTLIMACPDIFWGDGSLGNILSVAAEQNICIAAAHPRVNRDEFLASLPDGDIPNDVLVRLAIHGLHRTWTECDASLSRRNTWASGTLIRKIEPKLYAVHHHLPSIFLARFTQDDLSFFRSAGKLGSWDHTWPALLVEQRRHRILTSSDMFFAAELTDRNENIPPLSDANPAQDDKYRGSYRHHTVNENSVLSWRSA